MKSRNLFEETKEKSKRVLRFGLIALCVIVLNALLDFFRGLKISALLLIALTLIFCIVLSLLYKGRTRGAVAAIVFSINPILVLIAFAEGLKTGGYLFILPLIFALAFFMSNVNVVIIERAIYFLVTICSFFICVLFCSETSKWQHIAPELYNQMFRLNSILVAGLCTLFAFIGMYFERQYKAALLSAKNKAEEQEEKIKMQNENLQHIAFMNAHVVRAPLANILGLMNIIDMDKIQDAENKELLQMLETSAQQLDDSINEIVEQAIDKGQIA